MRTIQLRTFGGSFKFDGYYFFILNKGLNSGKPLKKACPNCFICQASTPEELQHLYWLSFSLWYGKAYHPYLKGSVIPFLTIDHLHEVLSQAYNRSRLQPQELAKSIEAFQKLEKLEQQYEQSLQLIRETKRLYCRRHYLR